MKIGIIREHAAGENRVALVPAHVPEITKTGASVSVERGAGSAAGYVDRDYEERGAEVTDRESVLANADLLLVVRAAAANRESGSDDAAAMKRGTTVVGLLDPYAPDGAFGVLAERRIRAFSMERIPRITRAQSMDVLSSQANLAGYRAALVAAQELPRMFPMMMTAAGTIVPARVFVVGVGVAGLQAIATARRLGAVVSAYDIRPAVKDQVESLGARFVEMELDAGETETGGGYAREMDEEFYRRQRELMLAVVAESDAVITTAAIPGKRAPVLVTGEMVEGMKAGSVVVDLAAERGGNCELTEAGSTVVHEGVRIVGLENVPSTIAFHASQLYSKNIVSFVGELIDEGEIVVRHEDEIVGASLVLENGECPDRVLADTIGVPYGGESND